MKKINMIIVFVIGMIALQSYGQTISNIMNVDSTLKKSILYSNALSFFALEFKSANDVIQMKDAETGKVIGKGIVDKRQITIEITCKDGKYKYEIDIEPFKNVIPTDIDFSINKFGMYNGKTKGTLIWVNGQASLSNIRFIYGTNGENTPRSGNDWIVNYDGSGTPAMMGSAYKKWRILVDEELAKLTKQYSDMSNPNEERNKIIIAQLIFNLNKEMSKKSEW